MAKKDFGTLVLRANLTELTDDEMKALEAAVAAGRGRASSFMDDADDIIAHARWAESKLSSLGLADSYRKGASFNSRHEGPSARSYKYNAAASLIRIERRKDGWYLVSYVKTTVRPKQPEDYSIAVTEGQMERMRAAAFRDFYVMEPKKAKTKAPEIAPANDDVEYPEEACFAIA